MTGSKKVKPILEMIAEKKEQIIKLNFEIQKRQGEIDTLEIALRRMSGQPDTVAKVRTRRSNVKSYLLDLLANAGSNGLNAAMAVEAAAKAGEHLERGTVSSLLSRFKHDRLVSYDGTVYRIVAQQNKTEDHSAVH